MTPKDEFAVPVFVNFDAVREKFTNFYSVFEFHFQFSFQLRILFNFVVYNKIRVLLEFLFLLNKI